MLKRLFITCLLVLGLSTTAYAQTTPAPQHETGHLHFVIAAMLVTQFADISTTEYGLGKGVIAEGNLLLKWSTNHGPIATAVVKGSVATGVAMFLIHKHRSHPKAVTVAAIIIGGVTGAAAYHNAHLISQLQK